MENVTILVGVNVDCFVVERELLIKTTDYFKRILDGTFKDVQNDTLMYPDITRIAFQDFIIWMHAREYRPTNIKRAFDLYELQQRFQKQTVH